MRDRSKVMRRVRKKELTERSRTWFSARVKHAIVIDRLGERTFHHDIEFDIFLAPRTHRDLSTLNVLAIDVDVQRCFARKRKDCVLQIRPYPFDGAGTLGAKLLQYATTRADRDISVTLGPN